MKYPPVIVIAALCVGVAATGAQGETQSGLILSGIDSVHIPHQFGYDFVWQHSCTSIVYMAGDSCYKHFDFVHLGGPPRFELSTFGGYGLGYAKVNLDSVTSAPPDSVLQKRPYGAIDTIPEDSLMAYIGNVYVLKSGLDPRPYINVTLYAKIKILNFRVVDIANYDVVMKFLWAANIGGVRDLHTAGLDTFHLEPPVLASRAQAASRNANHQSQTVFRVVGGAGRIPGEMRHGWAAASVYDVRGRLVGEVVRLNGRRIQLRARGGNSFLGVEIVKGDR